MKWGSNKAFPIVESLLGENLPQKNNDVLTLSCRIVVAPQITVAFGTISKLNKRSPPNNRSPGKIKEMNKRSPFIGLPKPK